MEQGCSLRAGVLHMPFGVYTHPELVFWTNGLEDVVEVTRAGRVERSRGRYSVIEDDETSSGLLGDERASPVLRRLSGKIRSRHGIGIDAKLEALRRF